MNLYREFQIGQGMEYGTGNSLRLKSTDTKKKSIDLAMDLRLRDGDQIKINRANGESIAFNSSSRRINDNSAYVYIDSIPRDMKFNFNPEVKPENLISNILDKITALRNLLYPSTSSRKDDQRNASVLEQARLNIISFGNAILKPA